MITLSCGHQTDLMEDTYNVVYKDYDCDAVDGFREVTAYAVYCEECALKLEQEEHCISIEKIKWSEYE